jgi:Gpi18-like mannosyltransferase
MHDRYFYPADILSIVYGFYFPRHFWVPIVTIMVSLFTYISYFFEREPVPLPLLAVILLVLIVFLVWETARAVIRQRDETSVGAMTATPLR